MVLSVFAEATCPADLSTLYDPGALLAGRPRSVAVRTRPFKVSALAAATIATASAFGLHFSPLRLLRMHVSPRVAAAVQCRRD